MHTVPVPGLVTCARLAPSNAELAIGLDSGIVALFHAQSGASLAQIPCPSASPSAVLALAFSPAAKYLASAHADGRIAVTHLRSTPRKVVRIVTLPTQPTALTFDRVCETLVIGDGTGRLHLLHLASGKLTSVTVDSARVTCISSSPHRRGLIGIGTDAGNVFLYDLTVATDALSSIPNCHKNAPVVSVSFSPVNHLLGFSAGLDGKLSFFDSALKKIVKPLSCAGGPVGAACFLEDGAHVVCLARREDGKAYAYDLRKGSAPVMAFETSGATVCVASQPAVSSSGPDKKEEWIRPDNVPVVGTAASSSNNATAIAASSSMTTTSSSLSGGDDLFSPVKGTQQVKTSPVPMTVTRVPPTSATTNSLVGTKHSDDSLFSPVRVAKQSSPAKPQSSPLMQQQVHQQDVDSEPVSQVLSFSTPEQRSFESRAIDNTSSFASNNSLNVHYAGQPPAPSFATPTERSVNVVSPEKPTSRMQPHIPSQSPQQALDARPATSFVSSLHGQPQPQVAVAHQAPDMLLHLLSSALDDALLNMRESLHADVQNMHLEMLRQFEIQRQQLEASMQRQLNSVVGELVDEIKRLRKENSELRSMF
jgi:protein NEDD1